MGVKQKLIEKWRALRGKDVPIENPWATSTDALPGHSVKKSVGQNGVVELALRRDRKYHVPGLLLFKRILACVLMVLHFVIAQVVLTAAPQIQLLFWLFLPTSFLLADYVWKTRK